MQAFGRLGERTITAGSERPSVVFLDANIVFSMAIGGPSFEVLLSLAGTKQVRFITSPACVVEATTNLERKRPDRLTHLTGVLAQVSIVEETTSDEQVEWARALIHPDDVHVLAAALCAAADVLLTGDATQFGHLMEREDLGLRVRTVRALLLDG